MADEPITGDGDSPFHAPSPSSGVKVPGAALDLSLLDTLDDREFDIPSVAHPPTLESILNAPDEDDLDLGAALLAGDSFVHSAGGASGNHLLLVSMRVSDI